MRMETIKITFTEFFMKKTADTDSNAKGTSPWGGSTKKFQN